MDIRKKQKAIVAALEDIKARDIAAFNVTHLTSLFDRVIIATADSNRQTRALARHVADKAREAGIEVVGIEGEGGGEWVLVDLGGIVVHVSPAVVGVMAVTSTIFPLALGGVSRISRRSLAAWRPTGSSWSSERSSLAAMSEIGSMIALGRGGLRRRRCEGASPDSSYRQTPPSRTAARPSPVRRPMAHTPCRDGVGRNRPTARP